MCKTILQLGLFGVEISIIAFPRKSYSIDTKSR